MPTPIDPKRLPRLRAALKTFGELEMASLRALAELYGVASNRFTTLTKQRFPEFPPPTRLADKSFEYPARRAVQSMIEYLTASGRAAKAKARRAAHLVSGAPADMPADAEPVAVAEEPEPLSAAELDRLASAQTRLFKLKRDQGLYTLAQEVSEVARGVNTIFTREIMNLVNEIDPNGELEPHQRRAIERKSRDIIVKLNDRLERFLGGDDADGAADTARTGDGPGRRQPGSMLRRRPAPMASRA